MVFSYCSLLILLCNGPEQSKAYDLKVFHLSNLEACGPYFFEAVGAN